MLQWDYDITAVHIYIITLTQENQTFSQEDKNDTFFAFIILSFLQPPLFFFPPLKLYLHCQLNTYFICLSLDRVQASSSLSLGGRIWLKRAS